MAQETEAETLESPIDHITVTQNGSLVQVKHDTPEADLAEAGFDLTDFDDAETFERLLAALDLNPDLNYNAEVYEEKGEWVPDPQYAKVGKAPDDPDRDYGVYVWANQKLALITGNNPITGEYSDPEMRSNEKGYASYIGLSGDPEAVEQAWDQIIEEATYIKGQDPDDRQFI